MIPQELSFVRIDNPVYNISEMTVNLKDRVAAIEAAYARYPGTLLFETEGVAVLERVCDDPMQYQVIDLDQHKAAPRIHGLLNFVGFETVVDDSNPNIGQIRVLGEAGSYVYACSTPRQLFNAIAVHLGREDLCLEELADAN